MSCGGKRNGYFSGLSGGSVVRESDHTLHEAFPFCFGGACHTTAGERARLTLASDSEVLDK